MKRLMMLLVIWGLSGFAIAQVTESDTAFSLADTVAANNFFQKAKIYFRTAQYDSAVFYSQKAGIIFRKAAEKHQEARFWEKYVLCRCQVSYYHSLTAQFRKAEQIVMEALDIALEKLGENHSVVADCYNNWGLVYYFKGDFAGALPHFQKTLQIKRKTLGENHYEIARSYSNIGGVYFSLGYFDEAADYFKKSLYLSIELLGEESNDIARISNNLGLALTDKGDYEQATNYLQKALTIRKKILPEHHREIAASYINIARLHDQKGDYEKAIENYHIALTILQPSDKASRQYIAACYLNLGVAYIESKDYQQALTYCREALPIYQELFGEHHPEIGKIYEEFTRAYLGLNDFEKALSSAQKGLLALVSDYNDTSIYTNPPLQNSLSDTYLRDILDAKAKTLARLYTFNRANQKETDVKQLEMSLATYQHCMDLIDQMRGGYRAEGTKILLGKFTTRIVEGALPTALQAYQITGEAVDKEKAFEFAEKAKAATLWQTLQDARAKVFAGIPDSVLKNARDLKAELTFYETAIQQQSAAGQDVLALQDQLFTLQEKYFQFTAALENTYPSYYNLKYQMQTPSLKKLQTAVDNQTALLEYFTGDSVIYIFTITKDTYRVTEISKPADFDSLANAYHLALAKIKPADYRKLTPLLYETLIAPVEAFFHGKHKLVIIPDGVLHRIPFETLAPAAPLQADFKNLDYLLKHYDISYHYSAKLYLDQTRQAERRYAKDFIGFAPVFADAKISRRPANEDTTAIVLPDAYRFRGVQFNGERYAELKYTAREVTEIRRLFEKHGKSGDIFLNQDADEEMVKSEMLGDYRFVHLATHAFVDVEEPRFSGLILSQPATLPATEDGILFAGEAYNLHLNADLVVLSACETGFGKIYRGEGAMALTRGFLYSGARNLVTSYWSVQDRTTGELMVGFYKNILEGKNYAKSLRAAKLKQLEKDATAFPGQWGAFVLIGE